MNRIIKIFLILAVFCFSFSAVFALEKTKSQTKHKIEFTTKDGFILSGDLYLATPASNKPLVVCMHSFSLNSFTWEKLASILRLKGYNVLAMDMRGHGRSVYDKKLKVFSRYQFTAEDWLKLPKDTIQSINYIKSNYTNINCNEIIIIGSDLGASVGAIATGYFSKAPAKMVLISPVASFKGLEMPVKSGKFINTKIMYVISKSERVMLNFHTSTPPVIKQYPNGGPGAQILKVNQNAIDDIVNFVIN